MTAARLRRPCAVAVSSAGEYAPGKIATELLFSHRNDAQLVFTGIAKAVGKGEVQKSLWPQLCKSHAFHGRGVKTRGSSHFGSRASKARSAADALGATRLSSCRGWFSWPLLLPQPVSRVYFRHAEGEGALPAGALRASAKFSEEGG